MIDISNGLRTLIYDTLVGGTIGANVYSIVPRNAAYPYVYISGIQQTGPLAKNSEYFTANATVQIVTGFTGDNANWSQANTIAANVVTLLSRLSDDDTSAIYSAGSIDTITDQDELTETHRILVKTINMTFIITEINT